MPIFLLLYTVKRLAHTTNALSVVVASPTPKPPETKRSLVAPLRPMTVSPTFKNKPDGVEDPKLTTPFWETYIAGVAVPVSPTTKTGNRGLLPAVCSTDKTPHGVLAAAPTVPVASIFVPTVVAKTLNEIKKSAVIRKTTALTITSRCKEKILSLLNIICNF